MKNLYAAMVEERARQDAMYGPPHARGYGASKWLTVLVEEVGEVAREIQEGEIETLVEELVQVAAVAMAFAEAMRE